MNNIGADQAVWMQPDQLLLLANTEDRFRRSRLYILRGRGQTYFCCFVVAVLHPCVY